MMDIGDDVIANQPIVIDNGSGVLKAGFAGEDTPKLIFDNYVGRPKHQRVMAGAVEGELFVGTRATELRGLLSLKWPIKNGIVDDWLDMEHVWNHVYTEMKVNSEEHPVLLTEAALNPRRTREKAAEIYFETFNCPALFMSAQPLLALYASGRTTGVVLDVGDGVTMAVPVYEGFALSHAIMRSDVAGRNVTDLLMTQLRRAGHIFHTTAEREIVRQMKEQLCYVSHNATKDEYADHDKTNQAAQYKLPDGSTILVGAERFRAPEALFSPHLVGTEYPGVPELLANSIAKSDMDLRKTLYSSIVLSGGSTMFKGFGDRTLNEVRKLAPKEMKIRISAPPERQLSTWMGGSILAALATFKKMWVSREEFEEDGAAALHKKTF
jgi:centractin